MDKKEKPGWFFRVLTGSWGYNGVSFFETLRLIHQNKIEFKKLDDYFKKHNLR